MESEPNSEDRLRDIILAAGVLQLGEVTFASGMTANNKLDMSKLFDQEGDRTGLHAVIAALGRTANRYKPDALWGVPTGGQSFARALGQVLRKPVIDLKKYQDYTGARRFDYGAEITVGISGCNRMVGIEDVSTTYGSVVGCLQLPELREATKAVAVIWSRGEDDPDEIIMPDMRLKIEPLIVRPMPGIMFESHELYRYGVRADDDRRL